MGLVTKTVKLKWNSRYKKYYESLGYVYTKMNDEFIVNVEDLQKGSRVKVSCKCDGCGKDLVWAYQDYNNIVKDDGCTYCNTCSVNLTSKGIAFSKSFYDWCIENDRQDVLERWDYETNQLSPKDINYGTNKKYYFKCNLHPEHVSELKSIVHFINNQEGSITCNQCNSIAQYILDNFPNKGLYDVWDKNKNADANPWEISKGNNTKKCWFICQEKEYHGSYETTCSRFTRGHRCPYCASQKVHPKDSLGQCIINNYGEDFLWSIWSDKNKVSPFELTPKSNKKVWWKCVDEGHEEYYRNVCDSNICGFRCPNCMKERRESIIEEKTRLYLESLGYHILHEHNCTVRPINPKTKMPMPYDNEIKELKLIIEVHGSQHYLEKDVRTEKHRSPKEQLRYQQVKDRYKKAYAEHHGYYYLEIPYTAYNKKETYKQMIDDKIEEILHNTKAS